MNSIGKEKESDVRNLGYSILDLVNTILIDIEKPLKREKM